MIQKEATAKVPANEDKGQAELGPVTVLVNYAGSLDESKQMFGEDAMLSNAYANWKVVVQSWIRSRLKAGDSPETIITKAKDLKMGVAAVGGTVDVEAVFKAKFISATPEEQKKMIANLRQEAKG